MPLKNSATEPSRQPNVAVLGGLAAGLLFMFGLLLFMGFGQATESSGMLWWQETHDVPMAERVGYLQGAIICWVAAVVVGGLTIWLTVAGQMPFSPLPGGNQPGPINIGDEEELKKNWKRGEKRM